MVKISNAFSHLNKIDVKNLLLIHAWGERGIHRVRTGSDLNADVKKR